MAAVAINFLQASTSSVVPSLADTNNTSSTDIQTNLLQAQTSAYAQPFYLRPAYRFKTITV